MTTVFVRITSEKSRRLLLNSIKDTCRNGIGLEPLEKTVLGCSWSRTRYSKFDTESLAYLGSWHTAEVCAGYVVHSVQDFLKLINKQLEDIGEL